MTPLLPLPKHKAEEFFVWLPIVEASTISSQSAEELFLRHLLFHGGFALFVFWHNTQLRNITNSNQRN